MLFSILRLICFPFPISLLSKIGNFLFLGIFSQFWWYFWFAGWRIVFCLFHSHIVARWKHLRRAEVSSTVFWESMWECEIKIDWRLCVIVDVRFVMIAPSGLCFPKLRKFESCSRPYSCWDHTKKSCYDIEILNRSIVTFGAGCEMFLTELSSLELIENHQEQFHPSHQHNVSWLPKEVAPNCTANPWRQILMLPTNNDQSQICQNIFNPNNLSQNSTIFWYDRLSLWRRCSTCCFVIKIHWRCCR